MRGRKFTTKIFFAAEKRGVEQQHKVNELIANLKTEGKTVLVISHNLEHVFTVADRLIVLRRGRRVGARLKSETTKEEIVGLITAAIKGDESGGII